MPTSNMEITKAWKNVADSADDPVMITYRGAAYMEVALTATSTAPTIARGHMISPGFVVTRDAVGNGYIWMRCNPDGPQVISNIEISK